MKEIGRLFWMIVGVALGVAGTFTLRSGPDKVQAASNDRYEDYVMCTGPVEVIPKTPTDGVWLLDYKGGKLLGTVIDRVKGKIVTWAEVDLVEPVRHSAQAERPFHHDGRHHRPGTVRPVHRRDHDRQVRRLHMGPRPDHQPGMVIRRHDMTSFRQAAK